MHLLEARAVGVAREEGEEEVARRDHRPQDRERLCTCHAHAIPVRGCTRVYMHPQHRERLRREHESPRAQGVFVRSHEQGVLGRAWGVLACTDLRREHDRRGRDRVDEHVLRDEREVLRQQRELRKRAESERASESERARASESDQRTSG